ncbi:ATP synthase F1 subunit delta [Chloroflexota bacterium]
MADDVYDKYSARVIFDTALKNGELNKWLAQLRKISDVVKDESVARLLMDAKASYAEKEKVLKGRLGEMDPLAIKLVFMLVEKRKLGIIQEIADEYQRLLDSYHGIEGAEVVEVTTAIPLEEKDRLDLAQRLTDIVKKPIVLKDKVDSGMIGGIIIRIGDKLIDGSIRRKLTELKKELD